MVDDTPMNRARKKQQQELIAQQKQQQKPQQSGGDAILKKDKQERALWGGSDSDVSEEGESEEEREECGTRSSSTKAARGAPGKVSGTLPMLLYSLLHMEKWLLRSRFLIISIFLRCRMH